MAEPHLPGAVQRYLGARAAEAAVSLGCHEFGRPGRKRLPPFYGVLAARTTTLQNVGLQRACLTLCTGNAASASAAVQQSRMPAWYHK